MTDTEIVCKYTVRDVDGEYYYDVIVNVKSVQPNYLFRTSTK